jgi:hypothetical protein
VLNHDLESVVFYNQCCKSQQVPNLILDRAAFSRSGERRRWSRFNKMFNQIRRFVYAATDARSGSGLTSLNKIFNRLGRFVQSNVCLFV